jgi:hypothetical protein
LSDGKNIFTASPPDKRLNEIRRRLEEPAIVLRLRRIVNDDEE